MVPLGPSFFGEHLGRSLFWAAYPCFGTVVDYSLFSRSKSVGTWLMLAMVSYGPLLWFWSVELAGGAQTLALLALSPLVAAFGGWLILGERLRWQMLLFGACSAG